MTPEFLIYNATDAACTLACHNQFWEDITPDFSPAYQMTIDLYEPLIFLMTRGIKVNFDELEVTKRDIVAQAALRQEQLNQLVGRELNVNSSKQCQQYFYVELGIPPYYSEGKVTVDDLALQRLSRGTAQRAAVPAARLVQEIRGLQKLHGTYLDIEFDSDGRMRCSYNPRGTKFGRLSSSKTIFGTGTNQQNLPQEFKRFLVPDEGRCFVEFDKRQAEWIVVAYLTGDANMLSVVQQEKDTHIHTAGLMMEASHGIPYEEACQIVARDGKLVGQNTDAELIRELRRADVLLELHQAQLPRTMSARQRGKKSNHGLNYDEGPNKYALINELTQAEGKQDVDLYHRIYPGIRVWYEAVKRQLQKDRTLTNCFGRKVRFMDQWGTDLWKAAYSMLPQSTVVDSLNQGMCKVYHDDLLTEEYDIDLLAQVHDSILTQVPLTHLRNIGHIQNLVYDYLSPELEYTGRKFKIPTDMKIGLNWQGYHQTRNPLGMREVHNLQEIPTILGEWRVSKGDEGLA